MIPILYESTAKTCAGNGLGRLHDCLSCIVTEERNGVYECDFEYPVGGYQFDRIQLGRIIGVTHDEAKDMQLFDIVGYSKPIDGVVTFHAVHVSYRLTKATVTASNVNSLSAAITKLNNNIEPNNLGFKITTNKSGSGKVGAFNGLPQSVRSVMGGMEGSLLDTFGGEWEFDLFTAKLWNSRGRDTNFRIRYGVNMTDYEDETDYSESYNAVTPYWVNGDDKYVSTMLIDGTPLPGGRTETVPLDLSSEFEKKPTTAAEQVQFATKAMQHIQRNKTFEPQRNIKVSFVRLSDSSEYEALSGLQQCRLCDTITVEFAPYGMSGRFKVVKTVWDVLLDRYEEIELGTLSTTLSTAVGVSSGGSGAGSDAISRSEKVVDTNLTLVSYGRMRVLEFHGYAPSSSAFATLDNGDRPAANMNAAARYEHTNGRFFPALLRVGTDGAVSASYFDSNTTTNTAISGGTIIGQVSWIV